MTQITLPMITMNSPTTPPGLADCKMIDDEDIAIERSMIGVTQNL